MLVHMVGGRGWVGAKEKKWQIMAERGGGVGFAEPRETQCRTSLAPERIRERSY